MKSRGWRGRVSVAVIVLACGAWFGRAAAGQEGPRAPGPDEIESDPIECWWKTDKGAVHFGEQFTLALTCGVIETSRIRVVVDPTRLDPMAVELTPFEVVNGSRHKDIVAPPRRYFQYSYTLRLLEEGYFGRDVDIPPLPITYNVQSTAGAGTQGRDQLYALPALPMRILSLVPFTATDIQDASPETFADIEARLFRANGELAVATICFAFAAVLVGLAVVRTVGRYRTRVPAAERPLRLGPVLRGSVRALDRLKSEVARDGWTPDLIGRALAVFRIAGAVILGRPVAQAVVDPHVPGRDGQLVLRKGLLGRKRALISAPTTAAAVAAHIGNGQGQPSDARTEMMLDEILESLRVFGAARYGRNGHLDTAALDTALDRGMSAIRRLRVVKLWPMRAADAVAKAGVELRETVWSR